MNASECATIAQVIPVLLLVVALPGGLAHTVASNREEVLWLRILYGLLVIYFMVVEYFAIQGAGEENGITGIGATFIDAAVIALMMMVSLDFIVRMLWGLEE